MTQSPAGWKLVPVEPTDEMRLAGQSCDGRMCRAVYIAMVEAAPLPASPATDRAELAAEAKRALDQCNTEVPEHRWHQWAPVVRAYAAIDALALDTEPKPFLYAFNEISLDTGMELPPARSNDAPSEPMYLVMAGGDGFQQRIVPESKLDEAYLLTQWCALDPSDATDHAAALEHFHDDDEWLHVEPGGGGDRLSFRLNLEDGWVEVIRLFSRATPPAASTSAPEAGTMEDFGEAATLVSAVKAATTNGEALGLVLAYRKRVRALAATTPAPACRAEPATYARAESFTATAGTTNRTACGTSIATTDGGKQA